MERTSRLLALGVIGLLLFAVGSSLMLDRCPVSVHLTGMATVLLWGLAGVLACGGVLLYILGARPWGIEHERLLMTGEQLRRWPSVPEEVFWGKVAVVIGVLLAGVLLGNMCTY